jgi:hypothetical protein
MERLEKDKAILDYLKHIATLTTGSIGVLTGFAEKFVTLRGGRESVQVAIVAFLISLLFNLVAYSISLFCFYGREGIRSKRIGWSFSICALLSIVG